MQHAYPEDEVRIQTLHDIDLNSAPSLPAQTFIL